VTDGPDEGWEARRTSFGGAAADYAAGRPDYPDAAVDFSVPDHARNALDLAAGTGILTAALLRRGLHVTAVEPAPTMRALIPPAAQAVDGTAEAIPLPDAAVDLVVVGQAFHWFDTDRALDEMARVLRPGGRLTLLWNLFDSTDPFSDEVAEILDAEDRTDEMWPADDPPFRHPAFGEPERRVVHFRPRYDLDRLLAYAGSRSQTIVADPEVRADRIARLRAAVPGPQFELAMVCEAWRAARVPESR
jgi:SAM-dependent methyltransferase